MNFIQRVNELRRQAVSVLADDAWHPRDGCAVVRHRFQQRKDGLLGLAAHDAVERTFAVLENFPGGERGAMTSGEQETVARAGPRSFGQIDDFRNVGEVIQREANRVRLPGVEFMEVVGGLKHLKVDDAHVMPSPPGHFCDQLKPQRLQSQIDL